MCYSRLLVGFFSISVVFFALSSNVASQIDEVNRGALDLGRRSKIVLENVGNDGVAEKNDWDSVSINLDLDTPGLGIFYAFVASFSMILVSEIGDETFIIAELMEMRHPKSIVLSGALTALIVMTVLSTGLGRIVLNLISMKHTNSATTGPKSQHGMKISLYISSSPIQKTSILQLGMQTLKLHINAWGMQELAWKRLLMYKKREKK